MCVPQLSMHQAPHYHGQRREHLCITKIVSVRLRVSTKSAHNIQYFLISTL